MTGNGHTSRSLPYLRGSTPRCATIAEKDHTAVCAMHHIVLADEVPNLPRRCGRSGAAAARAVVSGDFCDFRHRPATVADVLRPPDTLRAAGAEPNGDPIVYRVDPALAVFCEDPDGHLIEYLAMLPDAPPPRSRRRLVGRVARGGGHDLLTGMHRSVRGTPASRRFRLRPFGRHLTRGPMSRRGMPVPPIRCWHGWCPSVPWSCMKEVPSVRASDKTRGGSCLSGIDRRRIVLYDARRHGLYDLSGAGGAPDPRCNSCSSAQC